MTVTFDPVVDATRVKLPPSTLSYKFEWLMPLVVSVAVQLIWIGIFVVPSVAFLKAGFGTWVTVGAVWSSMMESVAAVEMAPAPLRNCT